MSTYLNGYALLEKVRMRLNEYSTAYCQGTDTTGRYLNEHIMDGINDAQKFLYSYLFRRIPEVFEADDLALTGVSSVYTLPADFGVLRYFKDSDGYQINPITPNQRRTTSQTGSDQHYYRKGNTLVLDKSGVSEVCTLIYYKKCREITQGTCSAGAATSITLATTAKMIADYYNGLTIEDVTAGWVDTIDDYSAARVATISETAVAADFYGTVSDMPEPFHHLMIPRAVFSITGLYPVAQDAPRVSGTKALAMKTFTEDLHETMLAFAGRSLDTYPEDIWCARGGGSTRGINSLIPGH